MATTTPAQLAAISVPYGLEADVTNSTIGQADPTAGRPDADRQTGITLYASGAQTAGRTVLVKVAKAGNVGTAGAIWRGETAGTPDVYWRGQNVPNVSTGFQEVTWSGTSIQSNPHALRLADDSEVCVYNDKPVAIWSIKAQVYDPATATYSTVSVTTASALTIAFPPNPALCLITDAINKSAVDVLLCAYWAVDTGSNTANIDIVASRDGGLTWATWATDVLDATITTSGGTYYTLGRIRFVAVGTTLSLVVHVTASAAVGGVLEFVYQYASGSNGADFQRVGTLTDAGYPELVSTGTVGYLAWISCVSPTDTNVLIVPLPDPWSLADTFSAVDLFGYSGAAVDAGAPRLFSFGTLAMTVTPAGLIYAYNMRIVTNAYSGHAASYNPATNTSSSLNTFGVSSVRVWWYDGNATSTEYPNAFTATWWRGGVHLYSTMASGTGTFDDKLCRFDVGGYSTLTLPTISRVNTDNKRAAWAQNVIPTSLLTTYGWTYVNVGAGSTSFSSDPGWYNFTTGGGSRYATYPPVAASGEIWEVWKVKVKSGGGVTSRVVMAGLTWDDGVASYSFEVRCSTTQIRFRDVFGAADGTTVTCPIGTDGIYLFGVIADDGTASVWYRPVSTYDETYWLPLEVGYALVDGGVGAAVNLVTMGNRAAGTAESLWVPLGGSQGANLGTASLKDGETLPTDLRPATLAVQPDYVTAGIAVGWNGGPASVGDSWTIDPDADHAYRLALPVGDDDSPWNLRGGSAPSATAAAKEWRGTATTGILWFAFPENEDRLMEQGLLLQAEGLNAPTAEVVGYIKATASIVSLGTLNQSVAGLAMTLVGSTLTVDPGTTSTSTPYFEQNELAGGYVLLDAGKVRPLIGNSAGQVKATPTTRQVPNLYIDPASIDGTETAASTVTVVYPRSTFVKFFGSGTKYSRLGLRWTVAPAIYESYIRARILSFGPITSLFQNIDWGYEYGDDDPGGFATMTSGLRFGRRIMNQARATLGVNFAIPVNQTPLYSTTQGDPLSYKLTSTSGATLAGTFGDTPNKLRGAWLASFGTRSPVVFLPYFTPGTPDSASYVGKNYVGFYGRMSEPKYTEAKAYGAVAPVVSLGSVVFTFEV